MNMGIDAIQNLLNQNASVHGPNVLYVKTLSNSKHPMLEARHTCPWTYTAY